MYQSLWATLRVASILFNRLPCLLRSCTSMCPGQCSLQQQIIATLSQLVGFQSFNLQDTQLEQLIESNV